MYAVCRRIDLEDMVRCQMACEAISQTEGLVPSPEEFAEEYQAACQQFAENEAEYDDERLQEQVTENLKVGSCHVALLLPQQHLLVL